MDAQYSLPARLHDCKYPISSFTLNKIKNKIQTMRAGCTMPNKSRKKCPLPEQMAKKMRRTLLPFSVFSTRLRTERGLFTTFNGASRSPAGSAIYRQRRVRLRQKMHELRPRGVFLHFSCAIKIRTRKPICMAIPNEQTPRLLEKFFKWNAARAKSESYVSST